MSKSEFHLHSRIPLERYMASLMPLQKDISPFKAAPTPHQFKQDDFLATLENSGPQLTSSLKGDWEGLYKRFFRSPNFKGWYESRYMELTLTLQTLALKALSDAVRDSIFRLFFRRLIDHFIRSRTSTNGWKESMKWKSLTWYWSCNKSSKSAMKTSINWIRRRQWIIETIRKSNCSSIWMIWNVCYLTTWKPF